MIATSDSDFKKKLRQVFNALFLSREVLIVTHQDPDGDGIGSMLALGIALERHGSKTWLFCRDLPPSDLNFLPYWHKIQTNYEKKRYDAIIALDYGSFERTGLVVTPENAQTLFITIDHHPLSNHRGHIQIVEPFFSSTSEIVYHLFREGNIEIDKNIATCLLTGIFFDTGGFRHSNTSDTVLRVAGDLLAKGGDLNRISHNSLDVKAVKYSKLWGEVLRNLNFMEDCGMVFAVVTKNDLTRHNTSNDGLGGLANFLCAIPEAKFSLFLSEEDSGCFRGSLRSEEFKGIDVSRIAKVFGGGGHKWAAGFITDLKPEEIVAKIRGLPQIIV